MHLCWYIGNNGCRLCDTWGSRIVNINKDIILMKSLTKVGL